MNRLLSRLSRLRYFSRNAVSAFRIIRDSRVAGWQKTLFGLLAGSYIIWPYDLVLDVPFVGQLDDLGIFILLLGIFMTQVPDEIKEEHGWRGF